MSRKARSTPKEGESNPALDRAIEYYQERKTERVDMLAFEVEAREALGMLMRNLDVKSYRTADGELVATLDETVKVKVKRAKTDPDDGDD